MASEIKVDNIKDQCGTAVITKCGATHTVTAEVYKANTIKDTSDNTYLAKCGSTVTLGGCGQTITLAAGASQSGFGRSGSVNWDTTAKTASFTAVSGNGYFVNTTSGAITVTLPATPSAGDIVALSDYAGTAGTNNITVARNGSNINGDASDLTISNNNSAITLVYVDGTQGWKGTDTSNLSDIALQPTYIEATGGTVTCCGDYKIHTFTGPGTFTVCSVGNEAGSNTVSYMIVAGGGGGGGNDGGGGGGGGYRESKAANDSYTASPLNTTSGPTYNLTVTAQGYPVVVGGGGTPGTDTINGGSGSNSSFSSITSAGAGGGKSESGTPNDGVPGGSGGGASASGGTTGTGGTGNTPPVSPPQGNNGGNSYNPGGGGATPNCRSGGGGGGAGGVGGNANGGGGDGGAGTTSSINGSPTERSSGAGGGARVSPGGNPGGAGAGGGATTGTAGSGTANTGGGGGGVGEAAPGTGRAGSGGSGIVIIRYKYQ